MKWLATMAAVAGLTFAAVAAHAAERVALILGNSGYATLGALPNTISDAEAVEAKLRELGFVNMLVTDATKAETAEAVATFAEAAKGAEIALFFYAGHGVQVKGVNLLIPIEAKVDTAADLSGATVPLDSVMAAAAGAKVRVMLIDTSRNDPFEGAEIPGLAAQAEPAADVLLVYSTAPGSHAMDGPGKSSPFVEAVLQHLGTPGDDLEATARKVMRSVVEATSSSQVPAYFSSLTQPVVLAK